MEEKKYRIVNNFTDAYTGERYTRNHEPIPFSDERVDEIRKVEKIQGYPLIEEVGGEPSEEDTIDVTEDETSVVEDGEPENGEPNEDTTEVTEETDETLVVDDNKKSNKKNKKN